MKAQYSNLPKIIHDAKRFVRAGDGKAGKKPFGNDWQKPQNWKRLDELQREYPNDPCGFVISNDGTGEEFVLLDFDHVLDCNSSALDFNASTKFASLSADCVYRRIREAAPNVYVERSQSGRGLHIFFKINASDLPDMKGTRTLYFDDKRGSDAMKLEIFIHTGGRHCLVTGDKFNGCGDDVPEGGTALAILQNLSREIQEQRQRARQKKAAVHDTAEETADAGKYQTPPVAPSQYDDPPEYTRDLALALMDVIDAAALDYHHWLSVISSLKNLGLDAATIDAWNQRDTSSSNGKPRYDPAENLEHLDSLHDQNFGIENLIGKAVGFDVTAFKRNWYREHAEFRNENYRADFEAPPETAESDGERRPLSTQELIDKLFKLPPNDVGNARRLNLLFGDRIRYLEDIDLFALYKTGTWTIRQNGRAAIYPLANNVAGILQANKPSSLDKCEYADALVAQWGRKSKICAAIELLKGEESIIITRADLDKNPFLLNVQNGVIDLETGKLLKHSAELLLSKKAPVIYRPDFHSDVFDNFMAKILPDEQTRAAVLRFFGYCLAGIIQEEKALFIWGKGGNGKGTLLKTILKMLGDYGTTLKISALLESRYADEGQSATPEFNKLEGVRFATAEEIPANRRLNQATFKLLTGNDLVPARRLHCESRDFAPTYKLVFSGNHLPDLTDANDPGLNRRLLVAKFEQDFTGENCDPTLKKQLATAEALSGILTVLVQECLNWQRYGLLESTAMASEKETYRASNDFISEFASEYCVFDADKICTVAEFTKRLRAESDVARGLGQRALANLIEDWAERTDGVTKFRDWSRGTSDRGKPKLRGLEMISPQTELKFEK